MTSPIRLGDLYREALDRISLDSKSCAFEGPLLRKPGANRILFYPGSFNPAHKGHLQLLNHSFHNVGDDLHLAGGVIVPMDDERLRAKMRAKRFGHVVTKDQRVRLLEHSGLNLDKFWVFPYSEDDWARFRRALAQPATAYGLEVRFVMLAGPDGVKLEGAPDPKYWDCSHMITSDVSRPVHFRTPNTVGLIQLSEYHSWEKVPVDMHRLRAQVRARLRGSNGKVTKRADLDQQNPHDVEDAVQAAASKIRALCVCHRSRKPSGWLRFVPANNSETPAAEAEAPSSTGLRRIMATATNDELETKLEDWALSASMLAEYVLQARQNGEEFEHAPVQEAPKKEFDPTKVKW